jgi:SAM-dependent methyltransferase
MTEGDYVLGTQDDEVERLRLQHDVWRDRVRETWARAGIGAGMTVIDVGAGPGFATTDLAELVGPGGSVIALERSPHFLGVLEARAEALSLSNIDAREQDVSAAAFGDAIADAAWCRWVLSFVADPQSTVQSIARALKPGGTAIFHEYAHYGTWRLMPPREDHERFRTLVEQSWRNAGGEPDIALHLPTFLAAAGMELVEARPQISIIRRSDFAWQWAASFMAVNAARLQTLGYANAEDAERFAHALDDAPDDALLIAPLVAEVIARKP